MSSPVPLRCAILFSLSAALSQLASAAVTTTGTVVLGNPGGGDSFGVVTVGPQQFSQPIGDPRGTLTIDDGTQFLAERLIVAEHPDALARATVTGPQTKVILTDPQQALAVGTAGSGYLRIDDGAWVDVGSIGQQFGELVIGPDSESQFSGPAHVEVAGAGTLLTVGGYLAVNHGIDSRLSISDGAVVRVAPFRGDSVNIRGSVELVGVRSELQASSITVQSGGFGHNAVLRVGSGAVVRPSTQDNGVLTVAHDGELLLEGGTIGLPVRLQGGTVRGSGTLTAGLVSGSNIGQAGRVVVGPGEQLNVLGSFGTLGDVEVVEGVLRVEGMTSLLAPSTASGQAVFVRSEASFRGGAGNRGGLYFEDSVIRFGRITTAGPNGLENVGNLQASRSVIEFDGFSYNDGHIELSDSTLTIGVGGGLTNRGSGFSQGSARIVLERSLIESAHDGCCRDSIENNGILEVRGGASTVNADLRGGGALVIGEGATGTFTGAEFFGGVAVAAGGAASFSGFSQLGRFLDVELTDANQTLPALSALSDEPFFGDIQFQVEGALTVDVDRLTNIQTDDEFVLIEADRIVGEFSEYDLPDLPGTLEFLPQQTDTTLSLLVIDTTETLPGDFNADGTVDAADYTLWRDGDLPGGSRWLDRMLWQDNYGRTLSPPASAVPEPAALLLVLIACAAAVRRRD